MSQESDLCAICFQAVSADYVGRRVHVCGHHPPAKANGALEEQKALTMAMEQCFPGESVLNDLMCNFPHCGTVVQLAAGWKKQREHISEMHGTKDYDCPANGDCTKRMASCYIGNHLRDEHHRGVRMLAVKPAVDATDGKSEKERYTAMKSETANEIKRLLPICFPHHHGDNHQHLTHHIPLPVGATNCEALNRDGTCKDDDISGGVGGQGEVGVVDFTMDESSQAECSAISFS